MSPETDASPRRLVSSSAMSLGAEEVPARPRISIVTRPAFVLVRSVVASLWFRALVTILLVGLVASQLDWHAVAARIAHGEFQYLALALALVVLALLIGAYRWRVLLEASELKIGAAETVRIYMVATFSGTFLPTTAGADLVRTLLVGRRLEVLRRTAVTVVFDRAAAFAGLLCLAWIGIAVQPQAVATRDVGLLAWLTLACALGAAAVVVGTLRDTSRAWRLLPSRMAGYARDCSVQIGGYFRQPLLLAKVLLSSLLVQVLIAIQVVLLARAIGVHLNVATAAVAVSLVTVVTLLPISIGGFGVREGTYVAVLGIASINATNATLISLLTVVTLFAASLPGAYLLARRGMRPAYPGLTVVES